MSSLLSKISRPDIPVQWHRPLAVLVVALLALLGIYHNTVAETAHIWWRSETYAHGMVIIPFSLYMLWFNRENLAPSIPRMSWWGVLALAPGVIGWLLGGIVSVLAIQQLALLWSIWSVALAVLGTNVFRNMLFPLAFLFLAVPLGEGLVPLLMDFTAVFTVKALQLTGIPVFWEGMFFTIPSGNFEVAKACSGVRYLFASVALGGLFAYINYRSYWRRAAFIGLAIALPIVANGLRAYGIVMLAHLSDMKLAAGVDHLVYGWVFFGIVMFVLFLIGSRWREDGQSGVSADNEAHASAQKHESYSRPLIIIGLAALLISGPVAQAQLQGQTGDAPEEINFQAPAGEGKWGSQELAATWNAKFHGASATANQTYGRDPDQVNLFMAFYRQEQQAAELISEVNTFYSIKKWTQVRSSPKRVAVNDGVELRLREVVIKSGGAYRIIWYWYDIGGVAVNNRYVGKLLQAWHHLRGEHQGDAALALMTTYLPEADEVAHRKLFDFLRMMYPSINEQLSIARSTR